MDDLHRTDHPTADPTDGPAPTRREISTLRLHQSVSQLLDQRDDLVGVHPMADLIHDSVRWSA